MPRDVVIGAGPAGLAAAAELKRRGRRPLVLECADRVGASWLSRYDSLRLNTTRWWSELPGLPIPRAFGTWVSAADYVRYLDAYTSHYGLEVRFGVTAARIAAADAGWVVHTSAGPIRAANLVVATGYDREPFMPPWPGREHFSGALFHSSEYRNARAFMGQRVLVVGPGNSGTDIAVDLARGGASKVWLSIRTPPQIVPRTVSRIPVQTVAVAARPLPPWIGDSIIRLLQVLVHGDLSRYGVPRTKEAVSVQFGRDDVVPVIDVAFVRELKRGTLTAVPAVEAFDGPRVLLTGGLQLTPDVVVAATGYRRALGPLVGELGVLDEREKPTARKLPGLFFAGYTNPLSGNLRELGIAAREIANQVVEDSAVQQRRWQTAIFGGSRRHAANSSRDF